MTIELDALRTSVGRLGSLVEPLDEVTIAKPAYPTEWTIADVMSHLGSGAVILQRRLDDLLAGTETPEDFAPATWDEWNAKAPRAQVDDGRAADVAFLAGLDAVSGDARSSLVFTLGPMSLDFDGFVGLRLNEHAFHTWDIEVALNPTASIPTSVADVVIDNLELVARYTAKPVGTPGIITIGTSQPQRRFTLAITPETATLTPSPTTVDGPVIELPAEAFARLVYGRLDPTHSPPFKGDPAVLDQLRSAFPGP